MILQINLNIYIYFFKSNSKIPLFTTWQRVSKRLMLFIASKQHSTILGRAHTKIMSKCQFECFHFKLD